MDIEWDDLRLFLAAVEHGSLSAAAKALGLAQATMSRRIARLEEQVGHVLFDRSRDGLAPTPAAEALLPHAEAMAHAQRLGAAALSGLEAGPVGLVRVALPHGAAVDLAPSLAAGLARRHPGLRLEVLADNHNRDLLRHEADVAVRSMRPERGDLVFQEVGRSQLGAFASRALLDAQPKGAGLDALPWVQWSAELAHIPMAKWMEARLNGRPPSFTSNSFLVLRGAVMEGLGAMLMPVGQGRLAGLVQLPIPTERLPVVPFYIVTHRALRGVPRVAAVVDFMRWAISESEDLTRWPPPGLLGPERPDEIEQVEATAEPEMPR